MQLVVSYKTCYTKVQLPQAYFCGTFKTDLEMVAREQPRQGPSWIVLIFLINVMVFDNDGYL